MAKQEQASKKLGGRMINMFRKLQKDETPRDFDFTGSELGPARLQVLIRNLAANESLRSLSLTRQNIEEEEGVYLA